MSLLSRQSPTRSCIYWQLMTFLLVVTLAPSSAQAQKRWDPHATHPPLVLPCSDPLCLTLQNVFDAALIDFREYRPEMSKDDRVPPLPDLSLNIAQVSCKLSLWANNVPMYICAAQQPLAGADTWFHNVLQTAKLLKPRWQAALQAGDSETIADFGPPGCLLTGSAGPYLGQCPLHVQISKRADGNAKISLWVNSFSSTYLLPYEPLPTAPPRGLSARNSGVAP